VQLMREKMFQVYRKREAQLCSDLKLNPELFLHFRGLIVPIYDAFMKLDRNRTGALERLDAFRIVVQFGFEQDSKRVEDMLTTDACLDEWYRNCPKVDFGLLLATMHRFRRLRQEARGAGDLQALFASYDVDQSGDLGRAEVYKLLCDAGVAVSSISAEKVKDLFEEADKDGSGTIDMEEFEFLFAKVSELLQLQRTAEEKVEALRLGYSDEDYWDLRECFSMLDEHQSGMVPCIVVVEALRQVKTIVTDKHLGAIGCGKQGVLQFEQFMQLMNKCNAYKGWGAGTKRKYWTTAENVSRRHSAGARQPSNE